MKNVLKTVSCVMILSSSVYAKSTLTCKSTDEAQAQGYEVVATAKKATLLYKSKKVAQLTLAEQPKAGNSDQKSVLVYKQKVINGYIVEITRGGIAGITTAVVKHGGVAGYTVQAELKDCR